MIMTPEERDWYLASLIRAKCVAKGNARTWSESDRQLRNEALYYEMGLGKSYAQICNELSERWGCHLETIRKYIRLARRDLLEMSKESIEEYKAKMMEKLERLAADAERSHDRKTILAAYDQMNKIIGAYIQKVEANVKETITFDFGE